MTHWIVSSKYSRDSDTEGWDDKWTADGVLESGRFFPSRREGEFGKGDRCILKVFGWQDFIGNFRIASESQRDDNDDLFYDLDEIEEWDFFVDEHALPERYKDLLHRSSSIDISENVYHELLGIRNFTQNLRLNYKNKLHIPIKEKKVEELVEASSALKKRGLQIVSRQREVSPGNHIDLLCKDEKGDYVVIELKKHKANKTIGQLARYVTDVRENISSTRQKVRAMILTPDIDEQLVKAARGADFSVVLYQLEIG